MKDSSTNSEPRGSIGNNHCLTRFVDGQETYGRHIIKKMLKKSSPYNRVVDIGAGCGADLKIAKEIYPGAEFNAVECYKPNVDNLKAQGFLVHNVNIETCTIPFTDESVDVVIANQVLEHTKEIFWITHQITRILKIGGTCIMGVPNVASFHNRALLLLGRHPTQSKMCSAHVRCFSKHDVKLFFKECWPSGYILEDFCGSQFYPFPRYISRTLAYALPSFAHSIFFMFRKEKIYHDEFILYPKKANLETNYKTTANGPAVYEATVYTDMDAEAAQSIGRESNT